MFFFKAINMLLDLDHGMSTAKCLWLLYKILHIIPFQQRSQILEKLLAPEKFYYYFFHWSYNVRMVFYHFYFFQLYQNLTESRDQLDNREILNNLLPESTVGNNIAPKGGALGTFDKNKLPGAISKITDATRTA